MKYLFLAMLMLSSLILMAAEPLGRITGSGPLTLDGKAIPATAVSSLPLVVGDEIATTDSSATIAFVDSSRAILGPHARVRLEMKNSGAVLHVLAGPVDLSRAKNSTLSLLGGTSQQGRKYTTLCPKPPPRSHHEPPGHDHDPD